MLKIKDYPSLNRLNFISVPIAYAKLKLLQDKQSFTIAIPELFVSDEFTYVLLFCPEDISFDVKHPFVVCELSKLYSDDKLPLFHRRLIFRLIPVFGSDTLLFDTIWPCVTKLLQVHVADKYINQAPE